jgi:hypothetical protein
VRFYVTDWRRVALTAQQVADHGLRDMVIIKRDNRCSTGRPHEAIETEALSQRVLVDLLRAELDGRLPEPLEDVQVREQEQRDELRMLLDGD